MTAIATEPSPATRDTRGPRAPQESASRPTLSVPRTCLQSGLASVLPRSCLSGSYGESTGASSATITAASVTATPNGASRALAARRNTAHRRSPIRDEGARRATVGTGSAISDPGIDEGIEQVHHEVTHDEADG